MIASRITFCIGSQGVPGWQLNELKTLSGMFRSVIVLTNISQGKQANLENSLQILSLKNCVDDLCQVVIEGLDAELACMVLSEYFSENHYLISSTHSKKRRDESALFKRSPLTLNVPVRWGFFSTDRTRGLLKEGLLRQAAECLPADQSSVLDALLAREAISSTSIGKRFALPHVMNPNIDRLTLVVHRVRHSLEWAEHRASPHLILTLLLPSAHDREMLLACTRLTRWLLVEENQKLLIVNDDYLVKIIATHVMCHYQP